MRTQPRRARQRIWAVSFAVVLGSLIAAACGSEEHAPGLTGVGDGVCVDKDGDGFGTGCWAGPDCDDSDPKVVCNGQAPCDANAYAPGCACAGDGTTHDCGKVTARSGDYLTCGYGSVRCSGGVWTDCSIDAERSGFLGMQRILALGAPTACKINPCDPYCKQFIDKPDPTVLHDAGRGGPAGAIGITDGALSILPGDGYAFPPPAPDGAPPPPPPLTPTAADLTVTAMTCAASVEVGSTISCDITVSNNGGTWAPTFTNDLRLSTDATIDNTDPLLEYCGVSSLSASGVVTLTCAGTIPAGTVVGAYFVGFIVDSGGTVTESDETNNTSSTPVSIFPSTVPPPPPPPPPADLSVTSLTCNTPVTASSTLVCAVTLQNTGGTWAPAFDNGLWLSTDGTIDPADTHLGNCSASGLAAAGSATVTCSGTLPAATAVGPYTVGIVVDSGNAVSESNETNNTTTTAITVSTAVPVSTPPDLAVTSVTCVPGSHRAGDTVSCSVSVVNNGGTWAGPFNDELRLSADTTINATDTLLGNCSLPGLNPGATSTVTCSGSLPVTTTPGPFFAGVIADSGNAVAESNELNNTNSAGLTVTATAVVVTPPDLVVVTPIVCAASVAKGGTQSCDVTFKNNGGTAAGAFSNDLRLSADATITAADRLLGTCGVGYLAAGATATAKCAGIVPAVTAARTWFAGVIADSGNVVPESDETNNTASQGFTVTAAPPAPEADITATVSCPASVSEGGTLSCDVTFTNGGGATAGTFANTFYLSADSVITTGDAVLGGCGVGSLGAGASTTVKCTGTVPIVAGIGVWFAGVIADSGNAVAESSETNNTASTSFVVSATPAAPSPPVLADIVVQSLTGCTGSVARGGTLSCNVTFQNQGATDAGAFTNELRLSANTTIDGTDALLGNCGLGYLAAGATATVTCSGPVPPLTAPGGWFAGIIADSGGVIVESVETNNTASAPITVTVVPPATAPDITVASVNCSATVAAGGTLSCAVTLSNSGGSPAPTFVNQLRLSPDAAITTGDALLGTCGVTGVGAAGTTVVTCSGTVPAGTAAATWYAGVLADSGNSVTESNETNNTGSSTFAVTSSPAAPRPADLVVSVVSCQASVLQGGTLACDVTVTNNGTTAAGVFGNELRLSADVTINGADTLLGSCGISGLAGGAVATVTCSGPIPISTALGPWFAGVIADTANTVTESNETNNTGFTGFAVATAPTSAPPADIVVTTVTCPATVAAGDTLTCDVTFSNTGGTAAGAFEDDLRLSTDATIDAADAVLGHCGFANLGAGVSATVKCSGSVPITAPTGPSYAGIVADSGNAVAEASETNNTNSAPIAVTAAPGAPPTAGADIVVAAVNCPANVAEGATLACDVTFTNAGGAVAGTFMNELRLSSDATITSADTLVGNCGLSGLAVATPVTVKCTGMIAAATATGTWYAGVIADTTNAVLEADETNNTASKQVTVDAAVTTAPLPGSDIVVESLACTPSADPGAPVSCTVVLKNQGGTDAPAFTNELRLSLDRTIDGTDALITPCDATALGAGATETITCSGTVPAGATRGVYYFGGLIADSAGAVTESNETNNTSYTSILVSAPPPTYGSAWYQRDYDGTNLCPFGYSPVWGLFSWNGTTPKDSHIDFSVESAPTNAGLASAQAATISVVARAIAATPAGYGGGIYPAVPGTGDTQAGSVIVNTVLSGANLPTTDNWLRVQANLVGSSDHSSPPSLGAWGLQVGCEASQ